jgi:hypothetical protein
VRDDGTAFHHQIVVGQFLRKIVVLFHQHNGHGAPVCQHSDDAANVLDDAGLNAFGWFIQNQELGTGRQCPGNGQLLLLPARQVAAPALQHLLQNREQFKQFRGYWGTSAFVGQSHAQVFFHREAAENFTSLGHKAHDRKRARS